jgi:hypothetical protein
MAMNRHRQHFMASRFLILAACAILHMHSNPAWSQEVSDFSLVILPDASLWLRNHSDHDHFVQAYHIAAPNEITDVPAWKSLEAQFLDDSEAFRSVFGQHISEWTVPSAAFSQPDGKVVFLEDSPSLAWNAHVTWPIGKPLGKDVEVIRQAVNAGQVTWFADYCELCGGDLPIVFEIPEPATSALLLCGLPLLFLFSRRRQRGALRVE